MVLCSSMQASTSSCTGLATRLHGRWRGRLHARLPLVHGLTVQEHEHARHQGDRDGCPRPCALAPSLEVRAELLYDLGGEGMKRTQVARAQRCALDAVAPGSTRVVRA